MNPAKTEIEIVAMARHPATVTVGFPYLSVPTVTLLDVPVCLHSDMRIPFHQGALDSSARYCVEQS